MDLRGGVDIGYAYLLHRILYGNVVSGWTAYIHSKADCFHAMLERMCCPIMVVQNYAIC